MPSARFILPAVLLIGLSLGLTAPDAPEDDDVTKVKAAYLRTLSRYVRPGTEAVARLTAEHDHARRGKHPRR